MARLCFSGLQSYPSYLQNQGVSDRGCCGLLGAGRLTKAAQPQALLDGRSLGPICLLTTLTHFQPHTTATQVSQPSQVAAATYVSVRASKTTFD